MNDIITDQENKLLNQHKENIRYLNHNTSQNHKLDDKLEDSEMIIFLPEGSSAYDKSWDMQFGSKEGNEFLKQNSSFAIKFNLKS